MSIKVKYHLFQVLFRFFSYLADKSDGWKIFVYPKLILGTLLLGLGVAPVHTLSAQNTVKEKDKKAEIVVNDSVKKTETIQKHISTQSSNDTINQSAVFCYIMETPPMFPGGEYALLKFIKDNIKYPQKAIKQKIEGKVVCNFVVDTVGNLTDIQAIRSTHPLLNNEAIRVIKSMPRWIPGRLGDKKIRIRYFLPIHFKLPVNDDNKKAIIENK